MQETVLRAKIMGYLETAVEGDLLRSIGMIAEAIGAERDAVSELVREMVRKGDVFEPIPRRYLRRGAFYHQFRGRCDQLRPNSGSSKDRRDQVSCR